MENLVVAIDTAKPQKASLIAELAKKLKSKVTLSDGAYIADARSFLELLLLWSTTKSHEFNVRIEGEDEELGAARISELFNSGGGI